ncbi:MAG: J domain-containing protein [Sulfuritalea sp.]|nr:J domain-containing protein [Sulfuritalea sp.]
MSDPYLLLGVSRDADDAVIRAAYLAAVRECPPDRDAERFARLRRAYDAVASHRLRLAYELFDREPPTREQMLRMLESEFSPRRADLALLRRALKGGVDGR